MTARHLSVITTDQSWTDLALTEEAINQVEQIKAWLKSSNNAEKKLKPGYRSLFYGPPGTGKTLTAALIGKEFDRPVYKIDLSKLVSKYIGETKKTTRKSLTCFSALKIINGLVILATNIKSNIYTTI